jgi:hypothetical protein
MDDVFDENPEEDILELQPREEPEIKDQEEPADTTYPETEDLPDEDSLEIRQGSDEDGKDAEPLATVEVLEIEWDRVLLGRTIPDGRPVYWEFGHNELATGICLYSDLPGRVKLTPSNVSNARWSNLDKRV